MIRCHWCVGHDSKQTSLGVVRPLSVHKWVVHLATEEESKDGTGIDVPRIGDSTWSLRDSKRELIYLWPYRLIQTDCHLLLSHVNSSWWRHTESEAPMSSTTSYCVILRHKSRIPHHREPSICLWAPVSPLPYLCLVRPSRQSWSWWHKEYSSRLTFVALLCVKTFSGVRIRPFTFERYKWISTGRYVLARQSEFACLWFLAVRTC